MVFIPEPVRRAHEATEAELKKRAALEAKDQQEAEGAVGEVEPAVEPVEEVPIQSQQDPVREEPEPSIDYEKRFKNYKANADVTIHELRTETSKLHSELALLKARLQETEEQNERIRSSVPRELVPAGVLSDEDMESLGSDNAARIAKLVQAGIDNALKGVAQKVGSVQQRLDARDNAEAALTKKALADSFWGRVSSIVERDGLDAKAIDQDKKFSDFLNSVDEVSGLTWRKIGLAAKESGDVGRMANIYQEFGKRTKPPSRMSEAAPRSAGSGYQAKPEGSTKIWTQKSFEQEVYKVLRGGPMSEAKQKRIDALQQEFQAALREGRVKA